MGILDEAIKEHLELKRQHGAGESELQQLEDEAFGAAERPGTEAPVSDALAEAPTEFMTQPEAPETEAEAEGEDEALEEVEEIAAEGRLASPQIADLQEAPELEPEAPADSEPPTGPSTEERHAIAEQPTEMFDVEEELAASDPAEEVAEIQIEEVVELEVEVEADDPDDEFWDEKRLSDELDQALEAPRESEPEQLAEEEPASEPEPPSAEEDAAPEPAAEEPSPHHDEDVLEETPDFLEEAPEDDRLWFEQKPPKDFDFDD